jgi:hypothetical protein
MCMKKIGVIAFVVLSLLLVSVFVSAQIGRYPGPGPASSAPSGALAPIVEGAENFYNTIFKPFGQFLLGANTLDGELFFAKLLFFIVLITLVNYALSQFPPLQSKSWIVSVAVSILAVRWITPSWIETVVLPYTALGITLTAFLPFVLFFFFVEKGLEGHTTMRKVAWIFAAVVFIGLFIYRDTTQFPANSKGAFNPANIYLVTAGLCLIMLFMDQTIQRAFGKARVSNMMDKHKYSVDYDTTVEYDKIMTNYNNSFNPDGIKVSSNNKIDTLNAKRKTVKGLPKFDKIS